MKFARIVFWVAAIWGVLILTPLYFIFDMIGRNDPPPITHPAFYYGFVSVGLAFQLAFIVIARDPVRLRPMMIPSVLEKFGYGATLLEIYGSTETGQIAESPAPAGSRAGRRRCAVRSAIPGRFLQDRQLASVTASCRFRMRY